MPVPPAPPFPLLRVTKRMAHHGDRAGYNRLLAHIEGATIWAGDTRLGALANSVGRRALRRLTGSEWYGPASAWAELRAAARARRGGLVHVMYGEDLLRYLPLLVGRRAAVVATFHQPPRRFEALVRAPETWARLDAVIVLDQANAGVWQRRLPGRVHTLFLGVDTDYWTPGGAASRADRVLFVGSHLRDLDTLAAVAEGLAARGVTVDAVVPAARVGELRDRRGLRVHTGISDAALRDLYRRAAALCLPLHGASASNTVLQALACGLPVVASDVGGMATYVEAGAGALAPPGDPAGHLAALEPFLDEPAGPARERAREAALRRSWQVATAAHLEVYAEVRDRSG